MNTATAQNTASNETNHPERDPFVEATAAIRALQEALAAHPAPEADPAGDPDDVGDVAEREKPRGSRWWKFW